MKRVCSAVMAVLLCLTGCAVTPPDTPDTPPTTVASTTAVTTASQSTTADATTAVTADATTAAPTVTETKNTTATATAPITTTQKPTRSPTTTRKKLRWEYSLFSDETRADGLVYTNKYNRGDTTPFSWSGKSPVWSYTQVGKYDIVEDGTFENPAPGVYYHEDPAEQLYIDTNTGLIKMNIFGSKFYDHSRLPDEEFTGQLLQIHNLSARVFISELTSLNVQLDFLLEEVECRMPEEEINRNLHTGAWYYYVFIQDALSKDWFYVGLPLYDWRQEGLADDDPAFGQEYMGIDLATGGIPVYVPSANRVWGVGNYNRVGERFTCDVDILPYVKEAFERIQAAGRFKDRSMDTFYVMGCNLGWEIPGTFDCRATVYKFGMTYCE